MLALWWSLMIGGLTLGGVRVLKFGMNYPALQNYPDNQKQRLAELREFFLL